MIGMNDMEYDEFVAGSAMETRKRLDSMHKIDIREFLDSFDLQFFGGKGDAPFFVTVDNRGVERVNKGLLAAYCRQNLAYVIIKELDGTAFKYVYDGGGGEQPGPSASFDAGKTGLHTGSHRRHFLHPSAAYYHPYRRERDPRHADRRTGHVRGACVHHRAGRGQHDHRQHGGVRQQRGV